MNSLKFFAGIDWGVRAPPRVPSRCFRHRAEGAVLLPWRSRAGTDGGRAAGRCADRTGRPRGGPRGSARTGGRVPDGTRSGPACDPPEAAGPLPGSWVARRRQGRPPRGPGSGRSPAYRRFGRSPSRSDLSGRHPVAGRVAQGLRADRPAHAPGQPDPPAARAVLPTVPRSGERSLAGLVPGTLGSRPDAGPAPQTPRPHRDPDPSPPSRAAPGCRHRPEDPPSAGHPRGGWHHGSRREPSPRVGFAQLDLVTGQLADVWKEIDRQTADVMKQEEGSESASGPAGQRDAEILSSLPGVGRIVRATLLAEAPDALRRRDDQALRCLSGVVPVPRCSGTSVIVVRRLAAHHRLQEAVDHWARVAMQQGTRPAAPGPVPGPAASRPPACASLALRRRPPARRGLCPAGNPDPVRPRPPKPGGSSHTAGRRDRSVTGSYHPGPGDPGS